MLATLPRISQRKVERQSPRLGTGPASDSTRSETRRPDLRVCLGIFFGLIANVARSFRAGSQTTTGEGEKGGED